MNNVDLIIFWLSVAWAMLFWVLWVSKIFKVYIWILIWVLFCLLINLKLNTIWSASTDLNILDKAFQNSAWMLRSLSLYIIPIFWFVFLLNNNISFKTHESSLFNMLVSGWLWFFLLTFIFGIYSVIWNLWLMSNSLLRNILEFLSTSSLKNFFTNFEYAIFLILFSILFYKFVLYYLLKLILFMLEKLHDLRHEERENRKNGNDEGKGSTEKNKKTPNTEH